MPRLLLSRIILFSFLVAGTFYLGTELLVRANQHVAPPYQAKNFSATILDTISQDFELIADDEKFIIPQATLASWPQTYVREYGNQEDIRLLGDRVITAIRPFADRIDRDPVDARLVFSQQKANVFTPAKNGRTFDVEATTERVVAAIHKGNRSAQAVIAYTEPAITLDRINSLGITTLIGKGESDFSGSPTSRIHNIKTATQRFNGVIIKPGEEFSFNSLLGEVTASTGYRPELVIKGSKLEYEYGGGVCQVSTTIFRAAIHAGLPITERKNHSFPVRYYNPQGFDSTVYPGVVDLKFTNNTPHHILVQGFVNKQKLTFEIYGTSDGRTVKVDHPVHYDQKPDGSLKAYFQRMVVTSDGTEHKDVFRSTYKAPVKYEANPLE